MGWSEHGVNLLGAGIESYLEACDPVQCSQMTLGGICSSGFRSDLHGLCGNGLFLQWMLRADQHADMANGRSVWGATALHLHKQLTLWLSAGTAIQAVERVLLSVFIAKDATRTLATVLGNE